jgi:hypothetical protein
MRKRLLFLGLLFLLAAFLDAAFFYFLGEIKIINWRSLTHAGWFSSALILFWVSVWIYSRKFWLFLFWLHSAVVVLSFANQYFNFSEFLNYNCLLFNLIFATAYFFASAKVIEKA